MLQILKGRRSASELIEGWKVFKCPDCAEIEDSNRVAKTKAPSMYSFNHEVCCDVWFIHDMDRNPYGIISFTCNGTAFQVSAIVMEGKGVPSSAKCVPGRDFRRCSLQTEVFTIEDTSREHSSAMVCTSGKLHWKHLSTLVEPKDSKES